ncbi:MAG: 3-deoxy-7-phosphoheptulonate synthase, partial [Bullifex sp.]|nr:3-deoxy-7-phosphoheptulonate synthase [Bullifex sp.]
MSNKDIRIRDISPLATPVEISTLYPVSEDMSERIHESRRIISDILSGRDQRLLAVVGPCSIHDPEAALDYADRL